MSPWIIRAALVNQTNDSVETQKVTAYQSKITEHAVNSSARHLFRRATCWNLWLGPYAYSALNNSYPVKEAQVSGESKIEYSFNQMGVLFIVPEANAQIEAKSDIWIYTDFPDLFLLTSTDAMRPKITKLKAKNRAQGREVVFPWDHRW